MGPLPHLVDPPYKGHDLQIWREVAHVHADTRKKLSKGKMAQGGLHEHVVFPMHASIYTRIPLCIL